MLGWDDRTCFQSILHLCIGAVLEPQFWDRMLGLDAWDLLCLCWLDATLGPAFKAYGTSVSVRNPDTQARTFEIRSDAYRAELRAYKSEPL